MTSMEDRGDNFEKKFAHDEQLKFKAQMRRNRLLGEWAAMQLGANAAEYVNQVIKADFEEAGDEDVIRKVAADFAGADIDMGEDEIRAKLDEFMKQAIEQIKAE